MRTRAPRRPRRARSGSGPAFRLTFNMSGSDDCYAPAGPPFYADETPAPMPNARPFDFGAAQKVAAKMKREDIGGKIVPTEKGYRLEVDVTPDMAVLDEEAGTFNGLPLFPAESLTLSPEGFDFIRQHEGHERGADGIHRLYDKDGGANCTIGYGHLVHRGLCDGRSSEEPYGRGLDEAAAQRLLEEDVRIREPELRSFVRGARVTQPMFDAMLSIHFNVGGHKDWQLFKAVREGNYAEAARQFDVVTTRGKPVEGIANRRRFEVKLFLFGRY